jgi:ADP-heptose:LPS heptosyltransferase
VAVIRHTTIDAFAMLIHADCKYYRGSMPCRFHKRDGRLCDGCADYVQVRTRLLIVKLAAVGDVLRTTSILPPLAAKYPGLHITWITRAQAAPLLEGNPLIDRVLCVEDQYGSFLASEEFDSGICLDADPLSATILSSADCREKLGFSADRAGRVRPVNELATGWWLLGLNDTLKRQNRKTYQQIMYEICGLPLPVAPPQLNVTEEELRFGREFAEKNGFSHFGKILGLNTGGGGRWQYKKWTFDGYLSFIRLFRDSHPETGILLLGGPEEEEQNREIISRVGGAVIDGGCRNSLMQFASLVAVTDTVLTSDSLAMHVAVALGKPTVVLVGPTSPWELDVFGKGEIVHSDIECLACYLSRCDKTVNCMNTLSPEYVLSRVEAHL